MLLSANAETGTNGVALVAGAEFDIVNKGTSGSHTYQSVAAINGTLGYSSVAGTGNTYLGWSTALGGTKLELWLRAYCRIDSYYSGSLMHVRSAGLLAGKVGVTTTGRLNVSNAANTFLLTSSTVIPLGSPFRVEFHALAGSGSTGTLEARLYLNKDATQPDEILGPFTTQTAASFDQIWYGPVGGTAGSATLYHDDLAASDTGWIGPLAVAATLPANQTLPAIAGQPLVGQIVSTDNGTWSGTPAPTYTYQWLRCDAAGNSPVAITNATNASYLVSSADTGGTLRAQVTATNSAGSTSATSAQTAVVTSPVTSSVALYNTLDGVGGSAVTTASSGGELGNPFDIIQITTGGSATFDSTVKSHGSAAMKAVAAGVSSFAGWSTASLGTPSDIYARAYIRFAAYPSAGAAVLRFAAGGTTSVTLNVTATGLIRVRNAAGTQLAGGVAVIPLNSWVRIEMHVAASTSSGTVETRLYLQGDSQITDETLTATGLALTANIDEVDFGLCRNATSGDTVWIDEPATDSQWIGPVTLYANRWGWGIVARPGLLAATPTARTAADVIWGSNLYANYGPYYGSRETSAQVMNRMSATYSKIGMTKVFPNTISTFNAAVEGQTPGKRSVVCTRYNQVDMANGLFDATIRGYVRSIPPGWYIILVNWQEPDSEMLVDNIFTPAQHVAASNHMADIVHDEILNNRLAAGATCEVWDCFEENTVKSGKWQDSFAALRTDGIAWDLYGNPNGGTTGHRVTPSLGYRSPITGNNYGVGTAGYDPRTRIMTCRDIAVRCGFAKFGFMELGAPFRQDDVLSITGKPDGTLRGEWFTKCYDAIIDSGAMMGLLFNAIGTNFDQRVIADAKSMFVDNSASGGLDATIITGPNWNPSSWPTPPEEPAVAVLRSYISQSL